MVQVNTSTSAFSVTANAVNSTNQVIAGQNSSYYTLLAREWAISPNLVQNTDYSAKYYADKSKEYADSILTDTGFIAVTESLTTINAVADDLTNINAAVANETNINAVVANATNINAAVANESNINSAVANETNINAVVTNESNINLVAGDKTNIDIVAAAKANVDTNATYINNINTTAQYISNINTVSSYVTQIDTIDNYVSAINTCSRNITNINTCATNISTIAAKVSKTGDTMVGDLNLKNKYVIVDSVPSLQYSRLCFLDTSGDIAFSMRGNCDYENSHLKNRYFYLTANNYSGYAVCFQYNETTNKYYIDVNSNIQNSITNWSFPHLTTQEAITIGTPGFTYTAPANGFINLEIATNGTDGWIKVAYGNIEYQSSQASAYGNSSILVPVPKSATITITYGAPGSGNDTSGWAWVKHHFIYAIGG